MKDTEHIIQYLAEDSELRELLLDMNKTKSNDSVRIISYIDEFKSLDKNDYNDILYIQFEDDYHRYIPKKIGKCKNLLILDLTNCIADDFSFLSSLRKLKILILDNCHLYTIPKEIFDLQTLQVLSLVDNSISDISQSFNLEKLVYLDLASNNLTHLPKIENFSNLQYFNVENNQIIEKPFFLENMEEFISNDKYEHFYFSNNPFIDNDKYLSNFFAFLREAVYSKPEQNSYQKLIRLLQIPTPKPQENTKPNENYFTLTLHKSFQTALIQYLYSFKEYVEIAKDKQFDFHIKQQQTELILITNGKNEVKPEELEAYFKEYVAFALQKSEERTINDETKRRLSKIEGDVLFLKIDNSVDTLRNSLKIVNLELSYLKQDNQKKDNEIDFLRTLSLKQADAKETQIKIANPQEIRTDLDQLLVDLTDKLVSMAERKHTKLIEDLHTDNLTDFLRDKGYIASDQSRSGRAKITAGEIDIMIRKANGTPISIIEAFRLSSAGSKNTAIGLHIGKLLNDYDTIGHERNFVVVYAEAKDFETLCENYETYMSEINGKDAFQATYPLISFKNTHISTKTDLKVYVARHRRNAGLVEVYHLVVNLSV
jgi:Leucine-rich repeat (LRR) protein